MESATGGAGKWRGWVLAIVLLGLGSFFAIDMLTGSRARPVGGEVAVQSAATAPGTSAAVGVASAKPSSAASVAASKPTVLWPEPTVPIAFAATSSSVFGDPFDGDGGGPGDVRELVRVGRTRLGVTLSSKMKDEKAVIAALTELGTEIDAKDKGRTDDFERRIMEYQPIFQKYRAKLAPHMEGAFAVKGGDGWTDTERVVHPHADAAP